MAETVTIRIIQAEELTSTLAPYFCCRIGENSVTTSSRYNTGNPVYHETFQLLYQSPTEQTIFLEYYDKFGSTASNENILVGFTEIPFGQYRNNQQTEWFTIENDGKTVGKVEIEILYADTYYTPRSPSPGPLSASTSSSSSSSSGARVHKRTCSRSRSRSPGPIPDETPSPLPPDTGPISDDGPISDNGPVSDKGPISDDEPISSESSSSVSRTQSPMISSAISPLPNSPEGELLQGVLVTNFAKLYAFARRKKRMTNVPIVKYISKVGYKEYSFGKDGRVCGSMGKKHNLPLTDFYAVVDMLDPAQKRKGGIQYSVHESEVGWVPFFENGAKAGTGAHGLEAIRIELTGEYAEQFDVWYSVRLTNGWTDWVKNGKVAGIEGAPGGQGATRVGSVAIASSAIVGLPAGSHASASGAAIALNDPRHIQAIRVECMEK